jgi:DNA-binding GntR family transcriptional regulator
VDKPLTTIPQLTLEAQVLDRLREAILDGYFSTDSQLNQVQIASQFGVSRGPVRAALSKLEEEGLVRNIPHRGTFVTPLDKKTVRDLYGVRATLEAYGVRLAIKCCTDQDIERIREIIQEMQTAAQRGDTKEVIRLDFMVHHFFIELADNAILLQTWSTLKVQVRRALSFRHQNYPDLQEIADSHVPFIELMQIKDADQAAKIMEAHIHEACDDLMERWTIVSNPPDKVSFYWK